MGTSGHSELSRAPPALGDNPSPKGQRCPCPDSGASKKPQCCLPFSVGGGTCRHLCRDWLHGRVKSPWAPEALGRPLSGSHFFWVQQHPHTLLPMLLGCPIHMGGIKDSLMLALSSRGRRKTVLLWGTAGLEQRRGVGADSKSCLSTAAPAARCGRDLRSRCPGNRRDGHLPGQPPIFV